MTKLCFQFLILVHHCFIVKRKKLVKKLKRPRWSKVDGGQEVEETQVIRWKVVEETRPKVGGGQRWTVVKRHNSKGGRWSRDTSQKVEGG